MKGQLPRPPQGWVALRWEVAVVFVGIALALGAQQMADWLYWRGQATQARRNIESELLEHEKDGYERLAVQPCMRGQLAALSIQLIASQGQWTAMPMLVSPEGISDVAMKVIPSAYRAPSRLWLDEAFKTAQATGALNHMSDRLVARYTQAYHRARRNFSLQDNEEEAAARLAPLAIDGTISADARLDLFAALSQVDRANSYIENNVRQELAELLGLLRTVPLSVREAGVRERITNQQKFRGACVLPLRLKA